MVPSMTADCLAPLTNPSLPRLSLPPGTCDCHAHVILPMTDHPFVEDRSYTPPPATLEAYKAMHRRLGIERAVIVQPSVYGTDNRVTLDAVRDYGPNCRGIAVVEPDCPLDDMRAMSNQGIRGARINMLFRGGVSIDELDALAARIAEADWHLQLLIDGPTLAELEPKLRALPVPIVVDHMGHMQARAGIDQPGFRALLRLVSGGRTWVKLSGNYRLSDQGPHFEDVVPFARALIAEGLDRLVWGTDWPHPAMQTFMPDDGHLVDAIDSYVFSNDQKQRILVANPKILYGFV